MKLITQPIYAEWYVCYHQIVYLNSMLAIMPEYILDILVIQIVP